MVFCVPISHLILEPLRYPIASINHLIYKFGLAPGGYGIGRVIVYNLVLVSILVLLTIVVNSKGWKIKLIYLILLTAFTLPFLSTSQIHI